MPRERTRTPRRPKNGYLIWIKPVNVPRFKVAVYPDDTVDMLKVKIQEYSRRIRQRHVLGAEGVPPEQQELSFEGSVIEGSDTLATLRIWNDCTVLMQWHTDDNVLG